MAISTYSELQTAIASWCNRNDLGTVDADFIVLAEARMRRDRRLRQISTLDFTASEEYALPSDFNGLVDLYHDGQAHFGPLEVVSPGELAERKAQYGDNGVPRYVAVIDLASGSTLRFAPEPATTSAYTLRMTYESKVTNLSDSNTVNWLLSQAPDLYLFACLSEAEGFLQEDQRVGLWEGKYEKGAREFRKDKMRRAYGGNLTPRPTNMIGMDAGRAAGRGGWGR